MSSTENLKNVRKFHQFLDILSHINISKQPVELCIYHLLFVFNPSHSTSELSQNQTVSYILYIYIEKLNEPGVIYIANNANMDPFSELIEEAFFHIRNDI